MKHASVCRRCGHPVIKARTDIEWLTLDATPVSDGGRKIEPIGLSDPPVYAATEDDRGTPALLPELEARYVLHTKVCPASRETEKEKARAKKGARKPLHTDGTVWSDSEIEEEKRGPKR